MTCNADKPVVKIFESPAGRYIRGIEDVVCSYVISLRYCLTWIFECRL